MIKKTSVCIVGLFLLVLNSTVYGQGYCIINPDWIHLAPTDNFFELLSVSTNLPNPPDYQWQEDCVGANFIGDCAGSSTCTIELTGYPVYPQMCTVTAEDLANLIGTAPSICTQEVDIYVPPCGPDSDEDGYYDLCYNDNCPFVPNGYFGGTCTSGTIGQTCEDDADCGAEGFCSKDQEDSDNDSVGDACDNCPYTGNSDQVDTDGDCRGDVCDAYPNDYDSGQPDTDGDGVGDVCDNCPTTSTPLQEDTDRNGKGDACEACIIQWWGDWIGWEVTNKTSRTAQACHEAFQALFNRAPDCSGPCYVPGPCDGTSCEETLLPDGCDGWGEYENLLGNIRCENEIVCESGEWSKYSYYIARPWYPGETYYYEGSWDVFCGIDTDGDGLPDNADNCPNQFNGGVGTCVTTKAGMVVSYRVGDPKEYITCNSDADCIVTGGTCQLVQGDCNNNGVGDVCECYANFDYPDDLKVNGSDLGFYKQEYGRIDCSEIDPC